MFSLRGATLACLQARIVAFHQRENFDVLADLVETHNVCSESDPDTLIVQLLRKHSCVMLSSDSKILGRLSTSAPRKH